jgi:hypothetical protein
MTIRPQVAKGAPLDRRPRIRPDSRRHYAALFLGVFLCLANSANSQEFRTIDPTGQWKGRHGVVSLMLTGDALSFCYAAVFGATAHLCDGVGVAGLVADGEYHYVDEQGTVAFMVSEQGVKMRTVKGIASFCGANWPGDEFTKQGFEAVTRCTVSDQKAHFYVVMRTPPLKRQAYVLKGDRVEVVPACFDGGDAWVLARFRGAKATTVGLLQKNALECLD